MEVYIEHSLAIRLSLISAKDLKTTKTGPFPDGHYLVVETGSEYDKPTRQGPRKSVKPGDVHVFRIDRRNIERIVQQLQEDVEQLP